MDHPARRSDSSSGPDIDDTGERTGRNGTDGETGAPDAVSAALREAIALLTDRERAIMPLLATGKTNKEIGKALGISPETVKTHVSAILDKLRARSRAEASAKFAMAGFGRAADPYPIRGIGVRRRGR